MEAVIAPISHPDYLFLSIWYANKQLIEKKAIFRYYIYKYDSNMKGTNLGEFEELVLLITVARPEEAYSVGIAKIIDEVTKRKVVHSVVHACLNRLLKKGFLSSEMKTGSNKRGGRRKRVYTITPLGMKTLEMVKSQRDQLWAMITPA